jgi:hypothetical protein
MGAAALTVAMPPPHGFHTPQADVNVARGAKTAPQFNLTM